MSRAASRNRAVVIAYHYPPDPAVGSLRARNVAQALAANGFEVDVISATRAGTPTDSLDGNVHVVRVVLTTSPRDFLTGLKRLVARLVIRGDSGAPRPTAPNLAGASWKAPKHVSTLRRWMGAITWLPDDRQGFIIPAARAATNYLRGDGMDILYTSGPPFSDHLVGLLLRRCRRFRWVLEFRDPWTGENSKPWFVRARFTDRIERWAENQCLLKCDGIVAVTRAYADVLTERYGDRITEKLAVVRNGVPHTFPPVQSDRSTFRIVHAGSFYLGRDPKPFLRAVAALHQSGRLGPRHLDVRLVGDCRHFNGEPIAPEVERLGLTDSVTFTDWLPHDETLRLMQSSDVLLLLAQRQPLSVPNKLFEYLGIGKPILAITDESSETAQLLRDVGGHFIVGERRGPEEILEALDALATGDAAGSRSPETLERLATRTQMSTLVEWLRQLPLRSD